MVSTGKKAIGSFFSIVQNRGTFTFLFRFRRLLCFVMVLLSTTDLGSAAREFSIYVRAAYAGFAL